MSYENCLMISQMKWLNLFDDIPYKYIKGYHDDDDMEVYIKDIGGHNYNKCKTKFTFDLAADTGSLRYKVVKEYDSSSNYAMYMLDLWTEEDEDERCAKVIQALARGVLTRRKIHFALLSADPDALARIM